MAEITPGYLLEQKVSTISNNDTDINAEITTQASDGWVVSTIILSGTDVIILFTRQTIVS